MKFIDLFAGIGGFRMGMERAGHECVGYVEIDKFARKSYEAIYDTEGEWTKHDITKITDEEWHQFRGGSMSSAEDSHAKRLALLASVVDLPMKLVERFFLKLPEQLKKSNHLIYSSKTSKDYFLQTQS